MTPRIAATTALAVALAAPATAAAMPALTPLRPCYVVASEAEGERQAVEVSGTGFTPGALVDVAIDGVFVATLSVDEAGRLVGGTTPAPYVEGADRPFTVVATEQGTGNTARQTARVTRLDVGFTPRRPRSPSSRVRLDASGFTASRPVYVHYVRGGVERRRVRLPEPQGACGGFSVTRRLFPFVPAVGRWTLQFDQTRRYARRPATAFWRLRITVREG